ncbi:MAG: hypothetical protein GEU82_00035 [Luteitalea sp.]|nr:hypothetical protein [Luteitalea sp.]
MTLLILGLVPLPLLVYGGGASWQWGWLGALAWAVSLVVKIPVTGSVYALSASMPGLPRAALSGLISSLSELGVAALLFDLRPLPSPALPNVLAFGAGAGCLETLFVFAAMFFESPPADQVARWLDGARSSFCVRHVQTIERVTAFGGHVGARGLISLSIYGGSPAIAVVAIVSFAVTDGLAAYGSLRDWDWFKPATCRRFHGACIAISTMELALFAILSASML